MDDFGSGQLSAPGLADLNNRQRGEGFDFTSHMRMLCADITSRLGELHHIDLHRVALSFSQTRKPVRHGLWASLTPMRFEGGTLIEARRGRRYTFQRLFDHSGCEMMYILTFYLPRYLNLSFHDKLVTIFHELWHINPAFNGDLRRHVGRCFAHTGSQKKYDQAMEELLLRWLALSPPENLYGFLRCRFGDLQRRYGRVYGIRVRHPKLIPLD